MEAVVWHGKRDGDTSPVLIKEPADAIVRATAAATCESELDRYDRTRP